MKVFLTGMLVILYMSVFAQDTLITFTSNNTKQETIETSACETLIGEMRPNLTYMLTFDDMAEHDASWKAFGGDAEWKRIRAIPEYADAKIVSRITRTFLVPAGFSQI